MKSSKSNKARSILIAGIEKRWEKVDADLVDPLVALVTKNLDKESITHQQVGQILFDEVTASSEELKDLHHGYDAFNSRHAVMETDAEREENIIAYAEELGATTKQLRGDRKAFRRYFGPDVMAARFQSRLGDHLRRLAFLLERLGAISSEAIKTADDPVAAWGDLHIESLTEPLLEYQGDARISTAAFRCLAGTILGLPIASRQSVLRPETVQKIHRLALDRERDVWIQSEAISLLYQISSASFDAVARNRLLEAPHTADDIFIRKRMVPLIVKFAGWPTRLCRDPSPFVRQEIANCIDQVLESEFYTVLQTLALDDPEPSVRAAALLKIPSIAEKPDLADIVSEVLREDVDEYILRVALKVSSESHAALPIGRRGAWQAVILPAIRQLHTGSDNLAVRRWAAQSRERIWCDSEPSYSALRDLVDRSIKAVRPGSSVYIKDQIAAKLDDVTLGRILSIVAQEDFGLDVKRRRSGIRIQRGHRFGLRFWRVLHEMKDPSPDKREGFNHTIGRIFTGNLRIPSALMGEMSQTKVPGEPLNLDGEDGWRPFLPLVDEVISSLDENSRRKPLRVVTSEGVTHLRPPRWAIRRMKAHHTLNSRFEEFARMRNSDSPSEYINALRNLGFDCSFSPPEGETTEPGIAQTFSHSIGPLFAISFGFDLNRLREYFYSAYENTIGQLLIFLAAAFSFFIARHVYLNQKFFRLRKKIPLVVGGWGTRGKSGTERIKAAMLNALGHRIVSKTTGCEAMFLYSPSFGKLHELFLFRPYDKATIWEQVNLVGLAAKLRSHVFLWECMGLTPAYIEVIQRQWMKDDISTIVNTYPDHEDLQGPAGINIPEVMTNFIRKGGHCLTSEQQMTPILESAAQRLDCRLDKVGWVEPGLLTPDILDRFPYAEHPNNIALVAELGEQMGIASDYALKEMADRVVPDLGVLKVYPEANISGRRLQFVNGFSANERFGALGNWTRLGFDQQDPNTEPGVWITAVVNNRDDRISRSRVFAGILAKDIAFDRAYFIGSNLKGILGYIREEFDAHYADFSLFPEEAKSPQEILQQEALRLRLPTNKQELSLRLEAITGTDEIAPWQEPYLVDFREYEAFEARIEKGTDRKALDREFKNLLWQWFSRKFVVIHDYHASGDQIINQITEGTPPGYLNRIMGLQNIKGTGLDFVYRWQAWDSCFNACEKLGHRKIKIAREGLVELSAFTDYGLLCEDKVNATTATAAHQHSARDSGLEAQLELIRTSMTAALEKVKATTHSSDKKNSTRFFNSITGAIFGVFESFLDGGDAIRRRRKADQIYRDLANERISPERVAHEIQKLNKRQKGAWLKKSIN